MSGPSSQRQPGSPAPRGARTDASREDTPEVFRPSLWLRSLVIGAIAFWVVIFFCLVGLPASSDRAFLSVGLFILLFTILGIFYGNLAIEVTREDVIVRGVLSFRLLPLRDVLRVEVKPGLLQTSYAVLARGGFVSFTSLFGGHRRLMELIVERARLGRM